MASPGSGPGDVFDVRKIRKLLELMNEHDLAEIDLQQGEVKVRLRRGVDAVLAPAARMPAPAAAPAPEPVAAETPANVALIKSPMVGTFYTASSPESPPFVKVGDPIGPESTVCIIEAMKVFNEIPAECSGKIVAMLVENGQPVEFNQPLFKVDTSQ
jgi:acetyl-CoA carboxylase biotin carboxyl carrier protein